MTIFAEQFERQLSLEKPSAEPVPERPVRLRFGDSYVTLNDLKLSPFAVETLRELFTESSPLHGIYEVLTLQRLLTADDVTPNLRNPPCRRQQLYEYLLNKTTKQMDSNDILVSFESCDLTKQAIHSLITKQGFSEELLNAYLAIMPKSVTVFDSLSTSTVLANIYNHDRVRMIFGRRGITLESQPTLVFPLIDTLTSSVQLIVASLSTHTVTLYRNHEVRGGLGNKPGVQFTAFFDNLV